MYVDEKEIFWALFTGPTLKKITLATLIGIQLWLNSTRILPFCLIFLIFCLNLSVAKEVKTLWSFYYCKIFAFLSYFLSSILVFYRRFSSLMLCWLFTRFNVVLSHTIQHLLVPSVIHNDDRQAVLLYARERSKRTNEQTQNKCNKKFTHFGALLRAATTLLLHLSFFTMGFMARFSIQHLVTGPLDL